MFGETCSIQIDKTRSLLVCVFITFLYVGSFYIMKGANGQYLNRDLPQTIKFRFCCIGIISIIAFLLVCYFCVEDNSDRGYTILHIIGIRREGFLTAFTFSLLLTMILFLGPLFQLVTELPGNLEMLGNPRNYWRDLIWLRTYIVGPLSEEFVFRACIIPLIIPAYGVTAAIFLAPLLFGLAHMHHIINTVQLGYSFIEAFSASLFQFGYTTIFGIYCSYLFIQTRHVISIITVHTFCNAIGFPDIWEIVETECWRRKCCLLAFYVAGFVLWVRLLPVVMSPHIYANNMTA